MKELNLAKLSNAEAYSLLQKPGGMKEISVAISKAIQNELIDYSVWRNLSEINMVANRDSGGVMPITFDAGSRDIVGGKINAFSELFIIPKERRTINVDPFIIKSYRSKTFLSDFSNARSNVMVGIKDDLLENIAYREDSYGFDLCDLISDIVVIPISTKPRFPLIINKDTIKTVFDDMESKGDKIHNVVTSRFGGFGIQQWETKGDNGYMGSLWGADFYCNKDIPEDTWYFFASPELTSMMSVHGDIRVEWSKNDENLYVEAYEHVGMLLHQKSSVVKVMLVRKEEK